MSIARKILFSGPEGSANIDGLIEALKKTSPAPMLALKLGGGRIMGEPMVEEGGHSHNANDSRVMHEEECD